MKKLSVFVVFIFLLSSCSPAEVLPTSTSLYEATKTPVPTSTETPLPTFTPTATLAPFTVECIIKDGTSTEEDCQLIREAVDLGRHYLLDHFGKDVTGTLPVKLLSEPSNISGGNYGQGFTGKINYADPNSLFMEINTAHPLWSENDGDEYLWRHIQLIIHEFTHFWQWQHGCWKGGVDDLYFLNEGQAQYIADLTVGKPELINPGQAIVNWTHWNYDESLWFNDTSTAEVAFRDLMQQSSPDAYMEYCELKLHGSRPEDALKSVFGITINEFRSQFKERTLGLLKDCTRATCGTSGGSPDIVDPVYGTMTDFIDRTLTQPNLIIHFTDTNGNPATDAIVTLCRIEKNDTYSCTFGEDGPINTRGEFIRPFETGTYFLQMCEPGYPIGSYSANPFKCVYRVKPFEVVPDETIVINFQFRKITDDDVSQPNLIFNLYSVDGAPVPNQYVQICSDEPFSEICLNSKTNDEGAFSASLIEGKYLIRLVWPGQGKTDVRGESDPAKGMNLSPVYLPRAEYEITDIFVKNGEVTRESFQYPEPNFILNFRDVVGGPLSPNQVFWLCRDGDLPSNIDRLGTYSVLEVKSEMSEVGGSCMLLGQADKTATFKARLPIGKYHVYFNILRHWAGDNDHQLADIYVTSETEVTEITFQLK